MAQVTTVPRHHQQQRTRASLPVVGAVVPAADVAPDVAAVVSVVVVVAAAASSSPVVGDASSSPSPLPHYPHHHRRHRAAPDAVTRPAPPACPKFLPIGGASDLPIARSEGRAEDAAGRADEGPIQVQGQGRRRGCCPSLRPRRVDGQPTRRARLEAAGRMFSNRGAGLRRAQRGRDRASNGSRTKGEHAGSRGKEGNNMKRNSNGSRYEHLRGVTFGRTRFRTTAIISNLHSLSRARYVDHR